MIKNQIKDERVTCSNNTPNNGRFPIGKSTVLLWTLAC